jgi:hypothetical protein
MQRFRLEKHPAAGTEVSITRKDGSAQVSAAAVNLGL